VKNKSKQRIVRGTIRKSPEFKAFGAMIRRCYAPSNNVGCYKDNNVGVCQEWRYDFYKFLFDMGCKPTPKNTLDRIDSTKDYSKDNCRWATTKQQSRNLRTNRWFTYKGKTKILTDWAKELGLDYKLLHLRITRSHLSFEKAIQDDPFNRLIEIDGDKKTISEWCQIYGTNPGTIRARIYAGWDNKKAITTPIHKKKEDKEE